MAPTDPFARPQVDLGEARAPGRVMQPKKGAASHVSPPAPWPLSSGPRASPSNRRGRLALQPRPPPGGTGSRAARRHAVPVRGSGAARRGRGPARASGRGVAAGAGALGAARGGAPEASGHGGGRGGAGAAGARPVAGGGGAGAGGGGAERGGAGPRGHVLVQVPEAGAGRRAFLGRYGQLRRARGSPPHPFVGVAFRKRSASPPAKLAPAAATPAPDRVPRLSLCRPPPLRSGSLRPLWSTPSAQLICRSLPRSRQPRPGLPARLHPRCPSLRRVPGLPGQPLRSWVHSSARAKLFLRPHFLALFH